MSGSLLLLVNYAGAERQQWIHQVLWVMDGLAVHEKLEVLAATVPLCRNDTKLQTAILDRICTLPTDDDVHKGFVVMARLLDLDPATLARHHVKRLCKAASNRLRAAAEQGRAEVLRTIADELPAFTALTDVAGSFEMAMAVRDVCVEWRWP